MLIHIDDDDAAKLHRLVNVEARTYYDDEVTGVMESILNAVSNAGPPKAPEGKPTEPHIIPGEDENGALTRDVLAMIHLASPEFVALVMAAPEGGENGRSEFVWVRLYNGDLVLGVFPRGDTYFDCEGDAAFPAHVKHPLGDKPEPANYYDRIAETTGVDREDVKRVLLAASYSGADAPEPEPVRYYVTATWDDWPEGGSYGTVVEAASVEEAEALCRQEMAESRVEPGDDDDYDAEFYLATYGEDWEVVDCFPLDEFIARHSKGPSDQEICDRFDAQQRG